jgi:hypothetical protein
MIPSRSLTPDPVAVVSPDSVEGTMIGFASISVASGHCAKGFVMRPSVRSHLAAGGAVAGAGILALSLVAAPPPDFNGARTEVRVVRLAAFALPPAAPLVALLEKFVSNQAQNVVPVSPVVGGAADITTAAVTALTFVGAAQPTGSATPAIGATAQSTIAPAITSQPADFSSWLTALEQDPTFGWIGQIIAGAIFFGLIVGGFVVGTVVSWWNSIFPPQPAISGASAATAQANATTAPALTTNSLFSGSAPVTTATAGPADAAPAKEALGKAGVSVPVTSTAASAPEPSVSASPSGPAKPTGRPATPEPVVRGSRGVGEQLRDLPHRDNGGHLTTRTAAAGAGAATAGHSSVASSSAASSSTGSSSSRGGSSRGGAGGS